MDTPQSKKGSAATEISQDHWSRFLDEFSKDHEGETARIEVCDADAGETQHLCRGMPLVGVTYCVKDRPDLIEIILEASADGPNLTHVVSSPVHVWHRSEQRHCVLQFEAADGTTTVLAID